MDYIILGTVVLVLIVAIIRGVNITIVHKYEQPDSELVSISDMYDKDGNIKSDFQDELKKDMDEMVKSVQEFMVGEEDIS